MRTYECENCHSIFVVNEADDRIMNGNYGAPVRMDCPMCMADMYLSEQRNEEENSNANRKN